MLDNIGHPVQRPQPVAQRGRAHLVGRRRDPHRAQGGPRARRPSYVRKLRATLADDVPGADVLLPRAGHLDPGAQLRPRRAHRRPGRGRHRQRGRRPTRVAQQIAERVEAHPRRGRRAPRPGPQAARAPHRRRPDDGGPARAHRARRRERPARLARLERAGRRRATGSTSAASSTSSRSRRRSARSTRSTRSNTTPDLDRRATQPQLLSNLATRVAHRGAR